MNAVIYARYSSEKQNENSIEGQVRVCKEYAERNGMSIVGEYIDRAVSGTTDNRPGFLRMIEDANRKEYEIILVYKLDRFARNQYDTVVYEHRLGKLGIKVVSATESITNSIEGRVLKSLIVAMAEMYSEELAQKVKRGNRENYLKGLWTGGHLLYGYKVENKKILIDEDKAEVVRFIFKEYAAGKTKKEIVAALNAKGQKNYSGKPFTIFSLQENLKNTKYIGAAKLHGQVYNNIYPAILDAQLFNEVQKMINKRKQAPAVAKARTEYLLTGKAYCGYCGDSFVGISGTSRTTDKHYYYTCSTRYKKKECKKANEKKEELENEVIRQTIEYVLKPKNINIIAEKLVEHYAKDINEIKIAEIEKRVAQAEREIQKCADVIFKTDNAEILKQINNKANDLSIQKKDLQTELSQLKFARAIKHTKQDFIDYLTLFIKGDVMEYEHKKKLIHGLVNSVWVFDSFVAVFYNIASQRPLTINEFKEALTENGINYDAVCNGSYLNLIGSLSRI